MAKPSDIKKIELADLQVDEQNAQKEMDAVNKKVWDEKKAIDAKYKNEVTSASHALNSVKEKITALEYEIQQMVKKEEWEEACQKEHVDEFFLKSLLNMCGLSFTPQHSDTFDGDTMARKKPLDNGIHVWLIDREWLNHDKLYLAFKGTELVGLSFRIKSQHAGDDTDPFSFIGDLNKLLTVRKKKSHYKDEHDFNATFTEWLRELKKLKADDIPTIPLSQETFSHINKGVKDWWEYYGWQRRVKELKEEANESL